MLEFICNHCLYKIWEFLDKEYKQKLGYLKYKFLASHTYEDQWKTNYYFYLQDLNKLNTIIGIPEYNGSYDNEKVKHLCCNIYFHRYYNQGIDKINITVMFIL